MVSNTWGGVTGATAIALQADDNSYGQFQVWTAPQDSSANDLLVPRFWIAGSGAATFTGNVGIGTNAPGASRLKVYNSTVTGNTQLHIHNDKAGDAAALRLEGKRTSSNDTGQLLFANNGNVVARIDAVSAADNGSLRFFTSVASTGSSVVQALTITDEGRLLHQNGSNSSRGGNATSALFKLKSGQNYVDIQAASTTSNGGLLFSDGGGGNYGLVDYKHSDDSMLFYTASSERMHIDSSGNVGIGTSAPMTKLHVFDGDGSYPDDANNHLVVESASHSYIGLGGGTTSDVGIHFGDSGGISRGRLAYLNGSDAMAFTTNGTERMRIDLKRQRWYRRN